MLLRITVKKKIFTCLVVFIIMMLTVYQYCENNPEKCIYQGREIPHISLTITHLNANQSKLSAHERWLPTERATTPIIDTLKDLLAQDNRTHGRSDINSDKQLYRIERVDFDEVIKEEEEREESKKGSEPLQEDGISFSLKELDDKMYQNETKSLTHSKKPQLPAITNLYREPTVGRFERVDKTILDPGSMSKKDLNEYFNRTINSSSVFIYSLLGLNSSKTVGLKNTEVANMQNVKNITEMLPKNLKNVKYRTLGPGKLDDKSLSPLVTTVKEAGKREDEVAYDDGMPRGIVKRNETVFANNTASNQEGIEILSNAYKRSKTPNNVHSDEYQGDTSKTAHNTVNATTSKMVNEKDADAGLTGVTRNDILPVHEDIDSTSGGYVKFTNSNDIETDSDSNEVDIMSETDGASEIDARDIGDRTGIDGTSSTNSTSEVNFTNENEIQKELSQVDSYEESGFGNDSKAELIEAKRQTDDNFDEEAASDEQVAEYDTGNPTTTGKERLTEDDDSGDNKATSSSGSDDVDEDDSSADDANDNVMASGSAVREETDDDDNTTYASNDDNNTTLNQKEPRAGFASKTEPFQNEKTYLNNSSDRFYDKIIKNNTRKERPKSKGAYVPSNRVNVRENMNISYNKVYEEKPHEIAISSRNYNDKPGIRAILPTASWNDNFHSNTKRKNANLIVQSHVTTERLADHKGDGKKAGKVVGTGTKMEAFTQVPTRNNDSTQNGTELYTHNEDGGKIIQNTERPEAIITENIDESQGHATSVSKIDDGMENGEQESLDDGVTTELDRGKDRKSDIKFEYGKKRRSKRKRPKRNKFARGEKRKKLKGKLKENGLMYFKKFSCTPLHPKVLLYNRIFKTGSTSLNFYLMENGKRNNFKVRIGSTEDWYKTGDAYPYPKEIEKFAKISPKKRFFSAHFFFRGDLNIGKSHTFINQVRDPVERVISHYYYMRQSKNRPKRRIIEMINSGQFNETLDECLIQQHRGCESNVMTHFFCGKASYCESGTEKAVKTAKYNMKHYYAAIGLLGRMDEYLEILKLRLPRFFPSTARALSWEKENVNKEYRSGISQETLEKIKTANSADYEIYEYAQELFEKQLEACKSKLL